MILIVVMCRVVSYIVEMLFLAIVGALAEIKVDLSAKVGNFEREVKLSRRRKIKLGKANCFLVVVNYGHHKSYDAFVVGFLCCFKLSNCYGSYVVHFFVEN